VDNDDAGKKLESELIRRLGPEKCSLVTWPEGCKDANDVLIKLGEDVLRQCLNEARPVPIAGIYEVRDFAENIIKFYESGEIGGERTGWFKLDKYYSVRPGEWTLITGIPSHGKSEFLDALMINLAENEEWHFGVCSPENQPLERHAAKFIEKYSGQPMSGPKDDRIEYPELMRSVEWLEDHFSFILPNEDDLSVGNVLHLAKALVFRKGIKGLVIDPWNELDHSRPSNQTETEYISNALTKIRRFARDHQVHVFLVAHPTKLQKKPNGTYGVPRPYDVSGCHAEGTEVLTSSGWIDHSLITKKHKVACFNLKTNKLKYLKPSEIWTYDYSGEMYNFKSPSYDALVTPNHRMVVKPSWGATHEIIGSGKGRPIIYSRDKWDFREAEKLNGGLIMPWATRWENKKEDIEKILKYPADEFIRFIGWWVAEGWFVKNTGGLGICQGVGIIADKMKTAMMACGINFTDSVGNPGTGGTINGWKAYIGVRANRRLCKWVPSHCGIGASNKKLPEIVWKFSLRQKEILLKALIEGDGSLGRHDSYSYTTTSKKLADDVQRLAIECGRMATVLKTIPEKENHSDKYSLSIGRRNRKTISLRKERNFFKKKYKGKVYCLTVPTGAYLVRRNGKPGIYGNSSHWYNKADNCITVWRDTKENILETEIHVQKIRFKGIGKPGLTRLYYNPINGRYSDKAEWRI